MFSCAFPLLPVRLHSQPSLSAFFLGSDETGKANHVPISTFGRRLLFVESAPLLLIVLFLRLGLPLLSNGASGAEMLWLLQ